MTGKFSFVNTVSAEHRQQLEASVIEAMPLANRNISGIRDMAPGVTKQDANEGSNATRLRLNGLGGSSLRVAADGTDASGNAGSPSLSNYQGFDKIDVMGMEAVGESQIVKGVLPAEYGLAMAGFLNVMTKSGNESVPREHRVPLRRLRHDREGSVSWHQPQVHLAPVRGLAQSSAENQPRLLFCRD